SGWSSFRRCGWGSCRCCGCGGSCADLELTEQLAAEYGIAFVFEDFGQHAISFGENFHYDLVGLDVDDQLVALDCFTRLLVPGGNGAVRDRLGKLGGFDLDSH